MSSFTRCGDDIDLVRWYIVAFIINKKSQHSQKTLTHGIPSPRLDWSTALTQYPCHTETKYYRNSLVMNRFLHSLHFCTKQQAFDSCSINIIYQHSAFEAVANAYLACLVTRTFVHKLPMIFLCCNYLINMGALITTFPILWGIIPINTFT